MFKIHKVEKKAVLLRISFIKIEDVKNRIKLLPLGFYTRFMFLLTFITLVELVHFFAPCYVLVPLKVMTPTKD